MLLGHSGRVNSVAFSHDGKYVLSGSLDKTIKVWDSHTGSEVHTLAGRSSFVTSVAFSYDGKYLLSSSRGKTITKCGLLPEVNLTLCTCHLCT
jgi:WD40 repeat protein